MATCEHPIRERYRSLNNRNLDNSVFCMSCRTVLTTPKNLKICRINYYNGTKETILNVTRVLHRPPEQPDSFVVLEFKDFKEHGWIYPAKHATYTLESSG